MKKIHSNTQGGRRKYPRAKIKNFQINENYEIIEKTQATSKKSMKQPYKKNWDTLREINNAKSNALNRFLQSNVGRNWDEVWSEICESTDCRNYQGHELREWVEFYVEIECYIDENGNAFHITYDYPLDKTNDLYVHPKTNILCRGTKAPKGWKKPVQDEKIINIDGQSFFKWKNLWYRVEMNRLNIPKKDKRGRLQIDYDNPDLHLQVDAFEGWNNWHTPVRNFEYKYGLNKDGLVQYCSKKESANSKEIKKIIDYLENKKAA